MPKKTTDIIIETNNDYVIAVKENQGQLYQQIRHNIEESDPTSLDYTLERNRGRIEERAVFVYDPLTGIDPAWRGLKRLVEVKRRRRQGQRLSQETAYYISSPSAAGVGFQPGDTRSLAH